jgi:hypothetical protein
MSTFVDHPYPGARVFCKVGERCNVCKACGFERNVECWLGTEPGDDIPRAARFVLWRDPCATARDVADLVMARREAIHRKGG